MTKNQKWWNDVTAYVNAEGKVNLVNLVEISEKHLINLIKDHNESLLRYQWRTISIYRDLSEDFIREFKDQVEWDLVSKYQDLSEEFLIEFIKDIEIGFIEENSYSLESFLFGGLKHNEKIPEDVKNRIINLKKVIDQ